MKAVCKVCGKENWVGSMGRCAPCYRKLYYKYRGRPRTQGRRSIDENPHRGQAWRLKYMNKLYLFPGDEVKIRELYRRARHQNKTIDHIVPLKGINILGEHVVSGLHVSWNLQILSASDNKSKGNRWDP